MIINIYAIAHWYCYSNNILLGLHQLVPDCYILAHFLGYGFDNFLINRPDYLRLSGPPFILIVNEECKEFHLCYYTDTYFSITNSCLIHWHCYISIATVDSEKSQKGFINELELVMEDENADGVQYCF